MQPDYIFETSWEVCNRVGGIYTVLSTRAASMQQYFPEHVVFFGPDLGAQSDKYFMEDASALPAWRKVLSKHPLSCPVRIGHWQVPGNPIAVLVDYRPLMERKNDIYGWAWERFGVRSHAAYGDYDDSSMFGYAVGLTIESLYQALPAIHRRRPTCVAHANEWQTAFTLFYIADRCPQIATLFTTHATSIGRSIAGNGKPLYDYFEGYHGSQMAEELNMVSKHSAERQAAHVADCFTTVSDITARECKQLLDRPVDIVTPNGFEPNFVPAGRDFTARRKQARQLLLQAASRVLQEDIEQDAFLIGTAGRLEWKNKGIDVFIDSVRNMADRNKTNRHIIAFVMVPYLDQSFIRIGRTSIIFVPYYLDGHAEVKPTLSSLAESTYYDLLIGLDLTIFPSYYEPWGYTPLESIAFHVPTITTSLSGFGAWASLEQPARKTAMPVTVIPRTDSNYVEVVHRVADTIEQHFRLTATQTTAVRRAAASLAEKAEWAHFFEAYLKAYTIALTRLENRIKKHE